MAHTTSLQYHWSMLLVNFRCEIEIMLFIVIFKKIISIIFWSINVNEHIDFTNTDYRNSITSCKFQLINWATNFILTRSPAAALCFKRVRLIGLWPQLCINLLSLYLLLGLNHPQNQVFLVNDYLMKFIL